MRICRYLTQGHTPFVPDTSTYSHTFTHMHTHTRVQVYLYTRELTGACTYQQMHALPGTQAAHPLLPMHLLWPPCGSHGPMLITWTRASDAPGPWAVTELLGCSWLNPDLHQGFPRALHQTQDPTSLLMPAPTAPERTASCRCPAGLSISEVPTLWDTPVCPKTRSNKKCSRTYSIWGCRTLLGGGMAKHKERSSELLPVCAQFAGHCQRLQHPNIALFTKSHPTFVLLHAEQSCALGSRHCHGSLCSLHTA